MISACKKKSDCTNLYDKMTVLLTYDAKKHLFTYEIYALNH